MARTAGRDGARSHTGLRRIKHWIKLDDETARLLREIVAIERAWGRQTQDAEVLARMIRLGHRMRSIEAHLPAPPPRPGS
jgi:transposase